MHALGAQAFEHRFDDVDLLTPHVSAFSGMRIEPRHQDARLGNAKVSHESGMNNTQGFFHRLRRDRRRHLRQRQVRGDERHTQAATDQHHHHTWRRCVLCEVFGMATEGHRIGRTQAFANHALVHRRRHHGGKLTAFAARYRPIQQIEHIATIRRIEHTRLRGLGQGQVQHFQDARARLRLRIPGFKTWHSAGARGALTQQIDIAQDEGPDWPVTLRQTRAQFGPNAGRLATGDGNDRLRALDSAHSRSMRKST